MMRTRVLVIQRAKFFLKLRHVMQTWTTPTTKSLTLQLETANIRPKLPRKRANRLLCKLRGRGAHQLDVSQVLPVQRPSGSLSTVPVRHAAVKIVSRRKQ